MKRQSIITKATLGVATLCTATVTAAAPAVADTVSLGGASCGPDQQVVLWFTLVSSSSSDIAYTYYDSTGKLIGIKLSWDTGTYHSVPTNQRSIDSWAVRSPVLVADAGTNCS